MTKDEFIAMVKKAGITVRLSINYDINGSWEFEGEGEDLERFAALVAEIVRADERKACARIAEEPSTTTYECTVACGDPSQTFTQRFPKHSHDIAKEIRARDGHDTR